MLEVRNVSVKLGAAKILSCVSLTANQGEVLGLIGPNGSGKTTLFNAISGFLPVESGSIHLNGKDVTSLSADARARLGLARVFQNFGVFHEMSLIENLLLALEGKRSLISKMLPDSKREASLEKRAIEYLTEVHLEHLATEKASSLSGGQKRLLEIMRAVAFEADVFLLDEPTAGVSPKMKDDVGALIRLLKSRGKTSIIIEHDMTFISGFCDRIVVLNQGTIALEGTPAEVRKSEILKEIYFGKDTGT